MDFSFETDTKEIFGMDHNTLKAYAHWATDQIFDMRVAIRHKSRLRKRRMTAEDIYNKDKLKLREIGP